MTRGLGVTLAYTNMYTHTGLTTTQMLLATGVGTALMSVCGATE